MKYEKYITWTMTGLLAMNVIFLLWYIFIGYQNYLHSDSATKVLLAREIYNTGDFFPKDWNYANGDLFILFGHVFIVPLLSFMPAGFKTHAISGAIFAGLILYGVWLITELGNIPRWQRIALVAVVASGVSGFMAENLYGQVSYGVFLFFCLYIVYSSAKFLEVTDKKRVLFGGMLLILLILAYWSNPKRSIVTYGFPLLGALTWILMNEGVSNKKNIILLMAILFGGTVIGSYFHFITIESLNNAMGVANARWLSLDNVLVNFGLTLKGLYAQFGGLLPANTSIQSKEGLYAGVRFLIATLAIFAIPISVVRLAAHGNSKVKLVAAFTVCLFALTFILQITTTIPDMTDPIQSSRYLVPAVLLGIMLMMMVKLDWVRPMSINILGIVLIGLTLILSSYHTFRLSTLTSQHLGQPLQINSERRNLINVLKENGLQYGYATYWNAGSISVLSNEIVRVRQVSLHKGIPIPMRWLGSNQWYRPEAWEGNTFILLHKTEIPYLDLEKLKTMKLIPEKQFSSGQFTVYVFPYNIATKLDGWNIHTE